MIVVVYPRGDWYQRVTPEPCGEIADRCLDQA